MYAKTRDQKFVALSLKDAYLNSAQEALRILSREVFSN
jgi:hypothetical protein